MTKEEIEAAMAANPEVQNVLTEVLKGKGLNVLSPDDHNKFVEQERQRIHGNLTSEIYSGLDKDLSEVAGFGKEGNEKTYDYAKRAVNTYKTKAEQLTTEIAALKEEIKTKGADPTLKAQLDVLQKKEQEWSEKEEGYKKQLFEKDVNYELSKGLAGFKAKAGIPEPVLKSYVDTVKTDLIKSAKATENGQIIYVDAEGKTILNKDLQPADATYILAERLKDVIDTGHQQTGAGTSGGGSTGGNGGTGGTTKVLPVGLKSQLDVAKALKEMGILDGDPEFTKLFDEYLAKNPSLPIR